MTHVSEKLSIMTVQTVFLKAKTNYSPDGTLLAALSEEDLERVCKSVPQCKVIRFDCGHNIHGEKPKAFLKALQ